MATPAAPLDRAYGVTNIKTHIPFTLDNNEHNYDAWRELFLLHCQSFDVDGHLHGTMLPADDNDAAWTKKDGLVKLWLYGTLSKDLFKISFKAGGTARELWLRLENYFSNNKEARAIQLDNQLRSKELGDKSIHDYAQELKSISDLMTNVDAPVTERALVTHMLNGLTPKYDNIINVIMHRQPFPSFDDARSMLLLEEDRLQRGKKTSLAQNDSSSSDKALVATVNTEKPQPQPHHQRQNRGRGRHNRGRGKNYNPQYRPHYQQWNAPFWTNGYNMWTQHQHMPWGQAPHHSQQGLLGPRPPLHSHQNQVQAIQTASNQNNAQPTDIASAYNTMTLFDPSDNQWYMDSGATAHLTNSAGNLKCILNSNTGKTVTVANGKRIPILNSGSVSFPSSSRPLSLKYVLVTPSIIKNLVSVRKFTKDNSCSIEFDPCGFSVKDLLTRRTLLRSNSTGDLYPVFPSRNKLPLTLSAFLATSSSVWHRRLAHPSKETLNFLFSSSVLPCNKKDLSHLCDACQLGKPIKHPFKLSDSKVSMPFEIVHSDLWTSPVQSLSGIKYYVLFLDQFSHFLWVYPLRSKDQVFSKFKEFSSYVNTQFSTTIKAFQCDNGTEFNNSQFHNLFASQGTTFRFNCPYTSQQNGRSERMIRTINNAVRTLLFQAQLPNSFWVEALHTAVHVLNLLPSKAISNETPFSKLFQKPTSYTHLKVFGCLCYPNQNHPHTKKLSPRSSRCILLGYPSSHSGYRCYDLQTKKIILSRHVNFDETVFPYRQTSDIVKPNYDFLETETEQSPIFKQILLNQTPAPVPQQAVTPTETQPPTQNATATEAPRHSMMTRSKHGITKSRQFVSLLTETPSPLPKSYLKALEDPFWNASMNVEYDAIIKSHTFDLVPRPPNANVIRCMWLHKHKYDAQGRFKKPKSRLVANGKTQQEGIDFSETFSPVVKPVTIRTVLHTALAKDWDVQQLDVQNAFLHGNLDETVYMTQPLGFINKDKPDHVCKLNRSIYGLRQAPRAWNARFVAFVTNIGFCQSKSDTSLFVYRKGLDRAYLLLYVDDIIVTASSPQLRARIVNNLKTEFPMTDSGIIDSFLGISAQYNDKGLFLNQSTYAAEILERAGMKDCKPCATPVDLKAKLSDKEGAPVANPTEYRSLAGALQYLTFTRPDISYTVQQICLFMHDPREPHFAALKRILRYIQGTKAKGLQLLRGQKMALTVYSDADWGGCPDTRRSTSGFCVYLGDNLVFGRLKDKIQFQDQAQKQSIRELQMPLQRAVGYEIYC